MSLKTREFVVQSDQLVFRNACQKDDLLDDNLTDSALVALLVYLVSLGWHLTITAIRCDHPTIDGPLGHNGGLALDCWPMDPQTVTSYLDANRNEFRTFLRECAAFIYIYQIELVGTANTPANLIAAGPTAFPGDGDDHVHLGVHAA